MTGCSCWFARFVAESSLRTRGNIVAVGEAIQTEKTLTLDCFGLRPRNDGRARRNDGLLVLVRTVRGWAVIARRRQRSCR
jgi:ribosomal protein L34